jgi:hypothetical protein
MLDLSVLSGNCDDFDFQGYNTVCLMALLATCLPHPGTSFGLLFHPENRGDMFSETSVVFHWKTTVQCPTLRSKHIFAS